MCIGKPRYAAGNGFSAVRIQLAAGSKDLPWICAGSTRISGCVSFAASLTDVWLRHAADGEPTCTLQARAITLSGSHPCYLQEYAARTTVRVELPGITSHRQLAGAQVNPLQFEDVIGQATVAAFSRRELDSHLV